MRISRFSEKEKNRIISNYFEGISVAELCKKHKISQSCFYKWLARYKDDNSILLKQNKKEGIKFRQIYAMQWRLQVLQTENEIFRKSRCGLNSSTDDKVEAIKKLKDEYSIKAICKTLGLLKSTYYHRVKRAPDQKWYEIRNEMLKPQILRVFKESKERFGARKIAVKLKQEGVEVNSAHVVKLMKEMGLVSKLNRLRHFNTTNRYSRFRKNRLKQHFD